jgi:DNA-binding MarR family transcriptional regulator
MMRSMARRLPLPTLLSFALVAFTIEFDNEAGHRIPHRTARFGATAIHGPWLVSMVMWFNCMRWVPEEGIAAGELERLARTRTNWDGMRRWGYIYLEPSPSDNRPKPPLSALIVRPTSKGRTAQEVWRVLVPDIEERWRRRFGSREVDALRSALTAIAAQFQDDLPDCMPILKYGLVTEGPKPRRPSRTQKDPASQVDLSTLPLPTLLARVLLAFALEFERESDLSLAICANVLRVMEEEGTAVRDLPSLSGVSKESIAMALGFLTKRAYATVHTDPGGSRAKIVLLTPRGVEARAGSPGLLAALEARWVKQLGSKPMAALREALEPIVADGTARNSPLFEGLEPYPEGWRAKVPKPSTLPHYPMVLHRGGYPDGS